MKGQITSIRKERGDINIDPAMHICICAHVCAHIFGKLTNCYNKGKRLENLKTRKGSILQLEGLGSSYGSDNNFKQVYKLLGHSVLLSIEEPNRSAFIGPETQKESHL